MRKLKLILILMLSGLALEINAQLIELSNGHLLPVKTTMAKPLRVLLIFAEEEGVNCSSCWQPDAQGNIPANLGGSFFDVTPSTNPQQQLSKHFFEASLGNYIVVGDYYEHVVSVPSNTLNKGTVLQKVILRHTPGSPDYVGSPFQTHTGLTISDFDVWEETGASSHGQLKSPQSNGYLDCVAVIWRNRTNTNNQVHCNSGWGFTYSGQFFLDGKSIGVIGEWGDCKINTYSRSVFTLEYIHAMYGNNNWHQAAGAGYWTFPFITSSTGLSAQAYASSLSASAWDRYTCDWQHPIYNPNNTRIPALDLQGNVVSADLSVPNNNDNIFILRDFYTTGDAIRIKLPHIDWQQNGDIKNQYLWLENRQKILSSDKALFEYKSCIDGWNGVAGIHAQIQVGKDLDNKNGTNYPLGEIYPGINPPDREKPNALGSWLFPLSAEGNYDFHFRDDLAGNWSGTCFSNYFYPIEKQNQNTLPNPLTGMNDMYLITDVDGDDNMWSSGEDLVWGLGEIINGTQVGTYSGRGSSNHIFRLGGNKKIGIGRNPAPFPVYTFTTNYNGGNGLTNYRNLDSDLQVTESYENRTIYLNGISIEIIEEIWNPTLGANDLKVKIRWDDYVVDQDTRWCGNIVLQNDVDDPNGTQSQVIIDVDKKVTLDQGRSATRHSSVTLPDGSTEFIKPTEMTLKSNTKLHLLENSTLELNQFSTLIVEDGAEIVLEENACIVVNESTKLLLKSENIQLNGNNARIIVKGDIETADGVDVTFTGDGFFEFHPTHSFTMGTNSIVSFEGSSINDEVLVLKEDTELNLESNITIRTGKVVYEANSSIYANNKEVRFIMCTLAAAPNSSPSATGIRTIDAEKLYMKDCVIDYLEKGIDAKSVAYTEGHYLIEDNTFQNNTTGLYFEGADKLQFYRNHLKYNDVCVDLKDVNYVYSISNLINQANIKGYNLDDVRFLYMDSDEVKDCQYGIYGVSSNAFLRGHTEITNNQYGVYMDNIMPDYALTVGDLSCGLIYDNYIAGVAGKNIILNIDTEIHACTRGDCSTLTPNTFHNDNVGNSAKLFDICYKLYSVDNTILAKGNY